MKALVAALLFAIAGCQRVPIETTPAAPVLLAVVTWNMNAGRGDLARLVSDVDTGTLTGARPADYLLLLQEAVEEPVTGFGRENGLSTFFVPVWHDGRVLRGNAILSTRPLLNARAIALPLERQPRTAAAAAIDVTGERLFVVSAHLENRVSWLKGGLLSDTARGRQAAALLRALPPNAPGILGGDLNTWLGENEPAWQAFSHRFTDTPTERPVPTFRDRLVLDHLFFDVPAGWQASRRVLRDRYGSDHHPVIGVLRQAYTQLQSGVRTTTVKPSSG